MAAGVVLQVPFDVFEHIYLQSTESLNHVVKDWFELRFGKLVLVKIHCWTDEGEPQAWELFWPGRDCYHVDKAPKFADPVSAAHWFYDNHIAEHT